MTEDEAARGEAGPAVCSWCKEPITDPAEGWATIRRRYVHVACEEAAVRDGRLVAPPPGEVPQAFVEKLRACPAPPPNPPPNLAVCPNCKLWFFDTMLRRCGSCGKGAPPEPAWARGAGGDTSLPEDDAIYAAHPTRSHRHDLYAEAMRLVGARISKGGLVALVNWLLHRVDVATKRGHMKITVNGTDVWTANATATYQDVLAWAGKRNGATVTYCYAQGDERKGGVLDCRSKPIALADGMVFDAVMTGNA